MKSFIKKVTRTLTEQVARHVQKKELFEKSGERKPHEVIFPKPAEQPVSLGEIKDVHTILQRSSLCFVHHWASWCDGCMEEIGEIKTLSTWLKQHEVEVVGVCWELFNGTPPQHAFPVVSHIHNEYPLPFNSSINKDSPEEMFEALTIREELIPQIALYKSGEKVWEYVGVMTQSQIQHVKEYVLGNTHV